MLKFTALGVSFWGVLEGGVKLIVYLRDMVFYRGCLLFCYGCGVILSVDLGIGEI